MGLDASQIEEADSEKLYDLTVKVKLKDGGEGEVKLKYREPTYERISGTDPMILENLIAEWDVKDAKPDYAYFTGRPLHYVKRLIEEITEDYNPSKK